jgi:DNA-directed RNA polymerase subunit H (RpoH/RPB5)
MKIPLPWKNALLLVLVFVAGGVAGGIVTHQRLKQALADAFDFDKWPDRGTEMLTSKLSLTPEQRPKIRAIQEDVAGKLKERFRGTMIEVGRDVMEAGRAVDQELTPEQRVVHEEMKREVRAAFKQHFDITLPEE